MRSLEDMAKRRLLVELVEAEANSNAKRLGKQEKTT